MGRLQRISAHEPPLEIVGGDLRSKATELGRGTRSDIPPEPPLMTPGERDGWIMSIPRRVQACVDGVLVGITATRLGTLRNSEGHVFIIHYSAAYVASGPSPLRLGAHGGGGAPFPGRVTLVPVG